MSYINVIHRDVAVFMLNAGRVRLGVPGNPTHMISSPDVAAL